MKFTKYDRSRMVFLRGQGMSFGAIAKRFDAPLSTVKSVIKSEGEKAAKRDRRTLSSVLLARKQAEHKEAVRQRLYGF